MQVSSNIVDYLDKEIPFALHVAEGHGHGNVYRITWSATDPDHFVLRPNEDCDLGAVVHKNDPRYKFYNVHKLDKPQAKKVVVVTRSDGVRKEFDTYRDALDSRAVDERIIVRFLLSAQEAADGILVDMKNAGLENCAGYRSLENLKHFIAVYEPDFDLVEFCMTDPEKPPVAYYSTIYKYHSESGARVALFAAAEYFNWSITEEERYE